jgi:hypothetical protein
MKQFLVFAYSVEEQKFVEAYPTHDRNESAYIALLPDNTPHNIIEAPSRTLARKWAYVKWIDNSGEGFNRLPISIHHLRRGIVA